MCVCVVRAALSWLIVVVVGLIVVLFCRWEPSLNNQFASWTLGDAKKILGARFDDVFLAEAPVADAVLDAVPAAFDSRTQWPGAIHPIRNQEQCGSCWAFGATEALSDRFAIETNLSTNVVLAPQDLVSCDNADGNQGCNGGYPIKAWQYMQSTGYVDFETLLP